ncbi:MAG: AAA family ATPase [Candidatus Fermentibacteraceae bacterium]|nr:AAA family ATPase [Candidatus Fermentibacteraceae bacterium]
MAEHREVQALRDAIKGLEAQRAILGDAVVDTSISALQEKLDAASNREKKPDRQLRKYVTVVFADVSGFTSICRNNDAENVTTAINTLWRALDTVIISHGGTVDKHIGDAVLAVWGLEGVREDDSFRAVEAALAMQDAAGFISSESHGLIPPFKIRIGIHTGPVFVSPVGLAGEYTVMGDTVNVASRLQSHAPPGQVIVSRNSWKHIQNDFTFRQLASVKVKGIEEKLEIFLVTGTASRQISRLNTAVLGQETVMVGRDAEMKTLMNVVREVDSSRHTAMVTVTGEAGIGKSRLLHEFRLAVEKDPEETVFFNARCTPGMVDIPCSVFRDILRFSFGVHEDDSSAVAFEKLEKGMGSVLEVEDIHLACNYAGFDMQASPYIQGAEGDPSQAAAGKTALVKYFGRIAAAGRTLVYLEDLHWADSVSLELIEQIVRENPQGQMLVLCLTRPPLHERMPQWGSGLPSTSIQLKLLSSSESRELTGKILKRVKNLPAELSELIVSNADGNPFYVEELVKMLVEDGVISQEDWTVNVHALSREKVPSTLTGVLQARLDTLPADERSLLQMASVVGRIFWDRTVKELYGGGESAAILELLSSVERHDLVHRMSSSTFSFAGEYLFKHAILRDVTYETVLLRLRKKYHRLVAVWLEHNAGDRVSEFASQIADHYENGEDWEKAVVWLNRSGKSAMSTSAYREALSRFERALAAPQEVLDKPLQTELVMNCGHCLEKLCRYKQAEARLEASFNMAEEGGLPGLAADALQGRAWVAGVTGRRSDAEKFSRMAFDRAKKSGNRAALARAYMRMAEFEDQSTYESVISFYWKSHSIYTEIASDPGLAITCLNMGNVALAFHRLKEAESFYRDSLALYTKAGNRWGIANCLGNLGCIASEKEEISEACEYYSKSLDASVSIGDREGEVICNLNLGEAALAMNTPEQALDYQKVALSVAESVGLIPLQETGLSGMSRAYTLLGDKAEAAVILMVLANNGVSSEGEKHTVEERLSRLAEQIDTEEFLRLKARADTLDYSSLSSELLSG